MSDIRDLTKKVNKWVSDRNWDKHQKPKDLAISICLEAAEVLEHFQWKSEKEVNKHIIEDKEEIADELADVAIYLLRLAWETDTDLSEAIENKLKKASKKYPVEKVNSDRALENYMKIKKPSRK